MSGNFENRSRKGYPPPMTPDQKLEGAIRELNRIADAHGTAAAEIRANRVQFKERFDAILDGLPKPGAETNAKLSANS